MSLALLLVLATSACDVEKADRKLAFLRTELANEAHKMHVWSWTWGSIYGSAGILQLSLLPVVDRESKKDLAIGAASSAIGATSLLVLPLQITRPITALSDEWENPDRCKVLALAEETLRQGVASERLAQSWIGHVGNAVFNIALTMLLGFAFGHWQSGLISGGIGIVIGELNLLTQPANLDGVLDDYTGTVW